jgi:Ca2+-binding RTX toxin-like protein
MLKPHVDSSDSIWRGEFAPTNVAQWFANYKAMMIDYAHLASADHVDMLCIGCEYDSLDGPAYRSQWLDIINAVRAIYKGPITYASDWIGAKDVSFWDSVDVIGVDAYNPLSTTPDPTVAQLEKAWTTVSSNSWVAGNADNMSPVDFYHSLSTTYNKPVVFTEIGYQSVSGAAENPGASQSGTVDFQEQENAYQAFFDVWSKQSSWMKGAFLWDWVPQPHPETLSYVGWGDYTPQDKPAEQLITQWYHGTAAGESPSPAPAPAPSPVPAPSPAPAPTPAPVFDLPHSGASTNWIEGTSSQTTLQGTAGNDYFIPGTSPVKMIGGAGDDIYIVNHAGDQIVENPGQGIDTVLSWSNSYTLPANVENLTIEGNWSQTGVGNSGNNIITAGTGADTLTGGGGRDMFVFPSANDHNNVVTDFSTQDVLDLRPLMQAINYHGSDPVQDHIVQFTQTGSNTIVTIDPSGLAGQGHVLATLNHVAATSMKAGVDFYWH